MTVIGKASTGFATVGRRPQAGVTTLTLYASDGVRGASVELNAEDATHLARSLMYEIARLKEEVNDLAP